MKAVKKEIKTDERKERENIATKKKRKKEIFKERRGRQKFKHTRKRKGFVDLKGERERENKNNDWTKKRRQGERNPVILRKREEEKEGKDPLILLKRGGK